MILVIVGAGASYDSVPNHRPEELQSFRPPLADRLFDDRPLFQQIAARFSRCQPIVPHLRHLKEKVTLEQTLAEFRDGADKNPERHKQLAAVRYYLQEALYRCEQGWRQVHTGVTNYKTFLDYLRDCRCYTSEFTCLVTFNYDTMLETAFQESFDHNFSEPSTYVSRDDYKFFKLHGSVNWGRVVGLDVNRNPNAYHAQALIEMAGPQLSILKEFRVLSAPADKVINGEALFPAIALPLEAKTTFECPEEHLTMLQSLLPQTTKLLTIGWRATERHFLKLLFENLKGPCLLTVSGNPESSRQTAENLFAAGLKFRSPDYFDGGFTDLILSNDLKAFLRR
jgi:hypothetical protein